MSNLKTRKADNRKEPRKNTINAVDSEDVSGLSAAQLRTEEAIDCLLNAISCLAKERTQQKLSASRVLAVAKEIREVKKVLSVYFINR